MGLFWRAVGLILVTLMLGLTLGKRGEDFRVVLTAVCCVMVVTGALTYLEPVMDFIRELEALGSLREDMLGILLKCVGVGLVAEMAAMVCTDGGNAALGKQIQLMASAAILYMAIPIFSGLLSLMQEILGEI